MSDSADLRINLIDAAGQPVSFTTVRVAWNEFTVVRESGVQFRPHYIEAETDQRGGATFCRVPARVMLPIFVLRGPEKRPVRADSVRLNDWQVVARDVRVP